MCLLVCFDVAKIVLFAHTTNKNMLNNILFLDILIYVNVFLISHTEKHATASFCCVQCGADTKK